GQLGRWRAVHKAALKVGAALGAGRWGEVTLADRTAGLAWAAEAEAGHVQATAALRTAPVRGNLHAGWGCRSPPRGACAPAGPLVARHAPDSQSGGSPIPAPSQGFSPTVREMSVSGQRARLQIPPADPLRPRIGIRPSRKI